MPGLGISPEVGIATHSSTLAWKCPWTEEPGRLPSMRFQRVGHDSTHARQTFFAAGEVEKRKN